MAAQTPNAPRSFSLTARDGYTLSAKRYDPADGDAEHHANILLGGATGVPQRFYQRFARYAAGQGFSVTTLDYRGVGLSAPSSLRGFRMSYLDWGELDLASAVDVLARENKPLFLVGHSFGGHALGLLPNHHELAAAFILGTGAGWSGWMPKSEALKVEFMWNVVFPPLVAIKGYLPWSKLGMGEDLPIGVYKDWKRWCRHPHYFFDDPAMGHLRARYADVTLPLVFATATDDPWAAPSSRDAFAKFYKNARLERRDIKPDSRTGPIGHMGYFRPACAPLWDDILSWLVRNKPERPPHTPASPGKATENEIH